MTLHPELDKPYASENQEPYVPEIEILNDWARFFATKGNTLPLDREMRAFHKVFKEVFKDGVLDNVPPNQLGSVIAKLDELLAERMKAVEGFFLGRPIMIDQHTGFAAITQREVPTIAWRIVPKSWQLHGELGPPTQILASVNGGEYDFTPSVFLMNPFFITDDSSILDIKDQLIIKIPTGQIDAPIREGITIEPAARERI